MLSGCAKEHFLLRQMRLQRSHPVTKLMFKVFCSLLWMLEYHHSQYFKDTTSSAWWAGIQSGGGILGWQKQPSMPENKNHWFRTMGPRFPPLFDHLMGWVPFEALALRGEEGRPDPCIPGTLFRALIVDTNHRSNTASAAFPRTTIGPRQTRWWQDGGGGIDS